MMPSLDHHHNYQSAYGGSSGTPSLSSSSTTATFSSNSTSLSGAISNLTMAEERPPALPPKRSRLPSHPNNNSLSNTMTQPQSPRISGTGGCGSAKTDVDEEDWSNPKLMKNISSLSPIICVCDNSAPSSYEGEERSSTKENRSSVDSENGAPSSPNTSQLYKQVSRTTDDRSSNGSGIADEVDESGVVLRRELVKQV